MVDEVIYLHTHRTLDHILALDTRQDPPRLTKRPVSAGPEGPPSSRYIKIRNEVDWRNTLLSMPTRQSSLGVEYDVER